jgi:NADH-quinone oxidoreductase subunit A
MINYIYILIFFVIIFLTVGVALLCVNFIHNHQKNKNIHSLEHYESGFSPKSKRNIPFNVRYYLIAMLFVIFNTEIILFLPFAIALKMLTIKGFIIGSIVFFLLLIGFIYQLKKGVLDWD